MEELSVVLISDAQSHRIHRGHRERSMARANKTTAVVNLLHASSS
jgi:hypothetical protein